VIFLTLLFSILINFFRILPAALLSKKLEIGFMAGFPTLTRLLVGLINISKPSDAFFPQLQKIDIMVWEQNFYVSVLGLAFIIYYGIIQLRDNKNYKLVVFPSLFFLILSVGNFYKVFFDTGIPLLSGERMSTRFFIMAVLYLSFLGAFHFQKNLHYFSTPIKKVGLMVSFLFIANDVTQHLANWGVEVVAQIFPTENVSKIVSFGYDYNKMYEVLIIFGGIITLLSSLFLLIKMCSKKISF
jgi:hypothetical protein